MTSTPCRTSDSTRTSAPVIGFAVVCGLAVVDGGHGRPQLRSSGKTAWEFSLNFNSRNRLLWAQPSLCDTGWDRE